MKYLFRPSIASDEANIIELATRAFCTPTSSPFLDPGLLRWKYWQPREDFADPRAYVMELEGRIVAHAGLWPVTVDGECGTPMIDWMSDPQSPGAGVALLQKLRQRFDFIYAIGGSRITQEILGKLDFQVVGEACTWARPLRLLQQMMHHQHKDWRLAARFGRNFWWSQAPVRAAKNGWSAFLTETGVGKERSEGFFRYLGTCPSAKCQTFQISKDGRQEGYFTIAALRNQARIAGIWLLEPSAENWRIAFELAQDAAKSHTEACEITARALPEHSRIAAAAAGMRLRNRSPIFMYKKRVAKDGLRLDFQMADNDAVFLAERTLNFLT